MERSELKTRASRRGDLQGARAGARGLRSSARAGFSLIETLAALAIFGLAIVAIIQGIGGALADWREAESKTRALALAENVLEEILYGDILEESQDSGQFDPPDSKFSWEAAVAQTSSKGLYQVDVRVSWNTGSGESDVALTTLKAERDKAQYQYVVTEEATASR